MAKRKPQIGLRWGAELDGLREAGAIAAEVLQKTCDLVDVGVTTAEIDRAAAGLIEARGCRSAFYGYRDFPGNICISINEQVVHGIGSERKIESGDIVKIDVGLQTQAGWIGDNAKTVWVGELSAAARNLLAVTEDSLYVAIEQAREGNLLEEVCRSVEATVTAHNYSVVRDLCGHGVGRKLHEEPQVPNYWDPKEMGNRRFCNPRLKPGMVLAIEPMVNAGGSSVKTLEDQWTIVTADHQLSSHFELMIVVTKDDAEILTPRERTFPNHRREKDDHSVNLQPA